jgi:integrase
MHLTDMEIKQAKPLEKPYRLWDYNGMYLEVAPSGGKRWRLKYRFNGKEQRISLGVYPIVSLKDARANCFEERKLLAKAINPSAVRKAKKVEAKQQAANSFQVIAVEWLEMKSAGWSPDYQRGIESRFKEHLYPWIGSKAITSITVPHLLEVLRRIEKRGIVDTAHRVLGWCGQVFRYAIATGRCQKDITETLREALTIAIPGHLAAITKPDQLAQLLVLIDDFVGPLVVRSALQLAPLIFVRPGELRKAKWDEIDLDKAQWCLTLSKQRKSQPPQELIVPLSRQAMAILRELKQCKLASPYVFPDATDPNKPMHQNAVLDALRSIGIGTDVMSAHGFRATARTILDEELHERVDIIEHQLGHAVKDPNGRAYNRTTFLPERRAMMQRWADFQDRLKDDSKKSKHRPK